MILLKLIFLIASASLVTAGSKKLAGNSEKLESDGKSGHESGKQPAFRRNLSASSSLPLHQQTDGVTTDDPSGQDHRTFVRMPKKPAFSNLFRGPFNADPDSGEEEATRNTRESGVTPTPVDPSLDPDRPQDNLNPQREESQDLTLSQASFCEDGALPTFIRVPQAMIMGIPTIVTTIEVVTCADYCRNNTEPASGGQRLCQGFNFQDSGAPTCEFFDVQAQLGPLNRNVGVRSFYYDKICLKGMDQCLQRPYSFEAVPDAQLQGNVEKSIVVSDEAECLSACLMEKSFTCHSINYVRTGRVCEMSRYNRRSKLKDFATNVQGVDYYENNCLTKGTRCASGGLYFVKTFNSEIRGFDVTEGQETVNSCLQKCLDSDYIFCRSAEYDRSTSECLVSDEDSFSMPGMVSTAESVGVDLYEPVCLPGAGAAEESRITCKRPYLFEKVLNTALNVPEHFRVLNGMTPEDCMITCARDLRCRSINFNRDSQTCMLSEFDRRNRTATIGRAFRVDYYENNCQKANSVQGCFFTLEGVGRKIRSEFRNREMQATSSVDCKMSCIRRDDACKSVSFNEKTQTCFHSQLNHKSAPFELLAQIDLDFDTYVKGDCLFEETGGVETAVAGEEGATFTGITPEQNAQALNTASSDPPQPPSSARIRPGGPLSTAAPISTPPVSPSKGTTPSTLLFSPQALSQTSSPSLFLTARPKSNASFKDHLSWGPFHRTHDSPPSPPLVFQTRTTGVRRQTVASQSAIRRQTIASQTAVRRQTVASQTTPECNLQLMARRRTLRRYYSNNHVNVASFQDCELMCATMVVYTCRSISYNPEERMCSLSELDLTHKPLATLTQFSPQSQFYARPKLCAENRTEDVKVNTAPPTAPDPTGIIQREQGNFNSPSTAKRPEPTPTEARAAPPGSSRHPVNRGGDRRGVGVPRVLDERQGRALTASGVQVTAICSSDGVNVSVSTNAQYTGAIYAAERFSFCRNLVTSQSQFWLFLPRPNVNSACNTIMVNDVLSGVVVISNDNVTPYDVTTKDDLFYQVSCDFSGSGTGEGGKVIVTGGLVVGGPTPRVVAGAGVPSTYDATLRILREGIPVQNVLIGEQLQLSIQSTVEQASQKMMLMNCNVSRIGGSGPLPDPLTIVENGCPMVNQVIGAIERSENGLFAPLTAFRIDGSAEIQIVCMVMFCPVECTPVVCSGPGGTAVNSLGRKKRETDFVLGDPEGHNIMESVNGRLKVYVQGEDGAPSFDEISGSVNRNCIPEATFVAVTAVLGLVIALLLSSLSCMLCRRSWMVALQHKLLTDHIGRPVSRYETGSPISDRSSMSSDIIKSTQSQPRRPALLTTGQL